MKVKQKHLWMCLSLFLVSINVAYSQEDEAQSPPIELEEVTVIARVEKDTFRTPNSVSVIDREQIERINASTTPRILRETVGVWAQQTTAGQGSPLLRGLTGYQAFLSMDGVRLNNSTFRSGPNQYLATISPDNLDRIEVLRGAGSMLYGSGAMGGGDQHVLQKFDSRKCDGDLEHPISRFRPICFCHL